MVEHNLGILDISLPSLISKPDLAGARMLRDRVATVSDFSTLTLPQRENSIFSDATRRMVFLVLPVHRFLHTVGSSQKQT